MPLLVGIAAALIGPMTLRDIPDPTSLGWWQVAFAVVATPAIVFLMLLVDPAGRRSPRNENSWFAPSQAWLWTWPALSLASAVATGLGIGRITMRALGGSEISGWDALPLAIGLGGVLGLFLGRKVFDAAPGAT